ncbi:TonB-dependent receptor [Paraflavitalea sp. CAU 1676]|uniref:TonB-dependent receptor n=1 Tax=Paraflavitalea sp. CAU 1676 TaxID=3032598 RepID=UPI0023DB5B25|nr:TonB-dependent receptor [Paraflavitalea sp. CAU 1676]MDF2193281.1 TonB-dependent receptor [Paraflavitalea sp. CAU 1676]
MKSVLTYLIIGLFVLVQNSFAQTICRGRIIDGITKEAIPHASIQVKDAAKGIATNNKGEFEITSTGQSQSLVVSCIGYQPLTMVVEPQQTNLVIALQSGNNTMPEVVISANRDVARRSQAPVAINTLTAKTIQDTKPITVDQVLNKVSGVYMVNLGNEQHSMSIRQPMTTKSLFLYLEDGMPIRTTGLFNHNALLEMNMAAVRNIEVVKGPSSSLYGSEAIGGVVNFITLAPTALPSLKLSVQGNDIGYKRTDLQTGFTSGKWGVSVNGYYADKRNSYIEYSDFHKGIITARVDYRFSDKTFLTNSFTWLDYYSDMPGGIDSAKFASKSFRNPQTFTYRKVAGQRYRSTLNHSWNEHSKSSVSFLYRNNSIGQNPAYSVKDDYRRQGSAWIGKKDLAHGEINDASFNSYVLIAQHKQQFQWKDAAIIGGVSADISPSTYRADYIRIKKDSVSGKYESYQTKDSVLTNYRSNLNNYAAYVNLELSPIEKLRVVASLRYDVFRYQFDNYLKPSSYSGSPDTVNHFSAVSPKIGFTYNFSRAAGIYANYSQGFVPPQVTEMYRGVKVPNLDPSVFYNYEAGGWISLLKGKLSADLSLYYLDGTNEVVSVKLDDGSSENRNAGKTLHKGIELGVNVNPVKDVSLRFSGAYSRHEFVDFNEKGVKYNGNEMNGAPNWIYNTELWYRPSYVKGLRLGVEWQHLGSYWLDPVNTVKYPGFDVVHLRAGYQWKALELWVNTVNLGNSYYAYTASKSSFGYSYNPAEPRNVTVGLSCDFGQLFKK